MNYDDRTRLHARLHGDAPFNLTDDCVSMNIGHFGNISISKLFGPPNLPKSKGRGDFILYVTLYPTKIAGLFSRRFVLQNNFKLK